MQAQHVVQTSRNKRKGATRLQSSVCGWQAARSRAGNAWWTGGGPAIVGQAGRRVELPQFSKWISTRLKGRRTLRWARHSAPFECAAVREELLDAGRSNLDSPLGSARRGLEEV